MLEVCLDANVFVAAFTPEPENDLCLNLIKKLQEKEADLYAPFLLVPEITSALYKKTRLHEFTQAQLKEALDMFFELPILLQWQHFIAKKAVDCAQKLNSKTSYDAFYLAVAMAREIPLVSFDVEFVSKAKSLYRQVFTPSEYLKILSLGS